MAGPDVDELGRLALWPARPIGDRDIDRCRGKAGDGQLHRLPGIQIGMVRIHPTRSSGSGSRLVSMTGS